MVIVGLVPCGTAQAEDDQKRSLREAKELFRVVKADLGLSARSPCVFDAGWSKTAIPEEVARTQFGITVRADLVASGIGTPEEVLNFQDADKNAFCDGYDRRIYKESKLKLVAAGAVEKAEFGQEKFSFPVFNRGYTKAAFAHASFMQVWYGSDLEKGPASGGSENAYIYKKIKGKWRKQAEVLVAIE
jgi:hypothetical protein